FSFKGKTWIFSRLCQGYCESPTIFNAALRDSLESLSMPDGVALLQYVDDQAVCAPSRALCEQASLALLKHLAKEGHKASKHKLQWCREEVVFLGHILRGDTHTLAVDRTSAIAKIPKPNTKKQLLSFLGTCSYCRSFVPSYAELEAPLRDIIPTKHGSHTHLVWTAEAEKAFCELKLALQQVPALGIPNPDRPFTQTVDEKNGCMTSVLCQKHGDRLRPVAYFSSKLDPVVRGLPLCLRAVAAAEKAVVASRDLVGYAPLTLLVPHAVHNILQDQKVSHLSAQRWLRYHTTLLEMPNITVKRCTSLNPATLLPTEEDGEPHDCVAVITEVCSPRLDLSDEPLDNPDVVYYVDGSASRDSNGVTRVGYAVVTDHETVCSGSLPSSFSAQAAELVALTKACELAKDKSATVFTDSRYAFGVASDYGAIWRNRKFLTSSGKHIKHYALIAALLQAMLLPRELSICKCAAHTRRQDVISRGNERADRAARVAALRPCTHTHQLSQMTHTHTPEATLPEIQSAATPKEKAEWARNDCVHKGGVWRHTPSGKPCLPQSYMLGLIKIAHGRGHMCKGGIVDDIQKHWYARRLIQLTQNFCSACLVCAQHTSRGAVAGPAQQAGHPPATEPFQHWQIDFVELTPAEGKRYLLVCICMFSKWIEAFATSKQDAQAVTKSLITEIIPRWGLPRRISSDNGTPFIQTALGQLTTALGIDMKKHCSYHPASAGAVERANGTIKSGLAKMTQSTGLAWPKVLPLVLWQMRTKTQTRVGCSAFEIVFGRPPNTGIGPPLPEETTWAEHNFLQYCITLHKSLSTLSKQVKAVLPSPADCPLHPFQPGDQVLVKDLRRNKWNQPRWRGPFQVLLVTHTAVKIEGRATWVHHTHCKKAPPETTPPQVTPE
ncbi:hypothetical protein MHYP_G00362390, partial [Metynnis hypsauchen]